MRLVIIFALLLTASCTSTGTVRAPEVMRDYDSVEGITYWTHTPVMLKNVGFDGSPAIFLQAAALCEGEMVDPCTEPKYILAFQAQGQKLTSSSDLTIRLGDYRARPEPVVYGAEAGKITTHSEGMAYLVSYSELERLATLPDGQVEGRLGGLDLNLSYERREAVRMLVIRLQR